MLVSVFIPTYNAVGWIDETLRSVLSQSYGNLEVWVVDDCSTDATPQILDEWSEQDERIHVLHKEKNEGFVPLSWNQVLPMLSGEFTFYMSHDDKIAADCIERLVEAQCETGADTVIPDCVFTYEDGRQKSSFSKPYRQRTVMSSKAAFAEMLNYDIPGFALWRTSLIRQVGMPTEAFNSDEGMQRIWALNSNKVVIEPSAKFYYLLTESSITRGLKAYHLTGLKTQKRLLRAACRALTFVSAPSCFIRFSWQYLKSWLYLNRQISQ